LLILLATATVARFFCKLYVARRKFWDLHSRGLVRIRFLDLPLCHFISIVPLLTFCAHDDIVRLTLLPSPTARRTRT
jgi:hypothetical protein